MNIHSPKPRLIVLTDISSLQPGCGEPDDTQSLIRLLLYSDLLDIEGLIATYSSHIKGAVKTDYLETIVRHYEKVWDNLLLHSADYPDPKKLLEGIRAGSLYCGMENVGEGKDTPGSNWIIRTADAPDPRPVWITIWGGATDLAQALWRVKTERSEEAFAAFSRKLRVYAIHDQYDDAGPWIRENCPEVFYITSYTAFRGMYRGGDTEDASAEWVEENLRNGHGPLGSAYPNYDGGDIWGNVRGVKEGDTPSFLYLLPIGPGSPDHPEWGGWGGRFEGGKNRYFDAEDNIYSADNGEAEGRKQFHRDAVPAAGIMENGLAAEENTYAGPFKTQVGRTSDTNRSDPKTTISRWRKDFQNSFQARMDWCTKRYEEANHEPTVVLEGLAGNIMIRQVRPGDTISLSAAGSSDPDGNHLFYHWWIYEEAGSCEEKIHISGAYSQKAAITIPASARTGSVHIILSLTDDGEPALTSYGRVILNITQEQPVEG